jgi:hypothetical protein
MIARLGRTRMWGQIGMDAGACADDQNRILEPEKQEEKTWVKFGSDKCRKPHKTVVGDAEPS